MNINLIRKNKIILRVLLIAVLIIFVGYLLTKSTQNSSSDTIKIGWIGPLSGNVKFLGIDNLNAVKMAVEEYNINKNPNEPQVELIFEDDQYDEIKTLYIYNKMVSSSVKIIFISTYDGTLLLEKKADKDEVILVNPINNDQQLTNLNNNNTFLIAKRTEQLEEILSQHILANNKKKALVIYYSEDSLMLTIGEAFKEDFEQHGGKAILNGYTPEIENFSSLLSKGIKEGLDTYILLGYIETKKIVEQAKQMNITSSKDSHKFYTVNTLVGEEFLHHFTYFTSEDGNKHEADKFLEAYEKKYNKKPIEEWTALQTYDATHIVLNAIHNSEKENFIEDVKQQMFATQEFQGVSGNISILPDGSARSINWSMYTLEDGKFVKE